MKDQLTVDSDNDRIIDVTDGVINASDRVVSGSLQPSGRENEQQVRLEGP